MTWHLSALTRPPRPVPLPRLAPRPSPLHIRPVHSPTASPITRPRARLPTRAADHLAGHSPAPRAVRYSPLLASTWRQGHRAAEALGKAGGSAAAKLICDLLAPAARPPLGPRCPRHSPRPRHGPLDLLRVRGDRDARAVCPTQAHSNAWEAHHALERHGRGLRRFVARLVARRGDLIPIPTSHARLPPPRARPCHLLTARRVVKPALLPQV